MTSALNLWVKAMSLSWYAKCLVSKSKGHSAVKRVHTEQTTHPARLAEKLELISKGSMGKSGWQAGFQHSLIMLFKPPIQLVRLLYGFNPLIALKTCDTTKYG